MGVDRRSLYPPGTALGFLRLVNHVPPVTCGDARAAQTTISSCPYRPTRREVAEWRTATLAALLHEQCEAAHLLSRVLIGGQPGCGAHRDAQRRDMSRGSPAAHPSERESDAAQGAHRPAAPLYAATAPRRRAPRPCEPAAARAAPLTQPPRPSLAAEEAIAKQPAGTYALAFVHGAFVPSGGSAGIGRAAVL